MPEVRADLTLDASSAESTIDSLGDRIDSVFSNVDLVLPVTADTSDAESKIGALADEPPIDIPVSADTSAADAEIHGIAADPVVIPVEADVSEAQSQIDDLGNSAADAGSKAGGAGAGGLETMDAAASILGGTSDVVSGSVGGLGEAGSALGPAMA